MMVLRIRRLYVFLTFLVLSSITSLIYAEDEKIGECRPPEKVELEIGVRGTIPYICENSIALFWYYDNGESSQDLFIYIENSRKRGSGYTSGEYDIDGKGSLIISNVSQVHERNYTVLIQIPGNTRTVEAHVTVNVYALPHLRHPVVNDDTERYVISNGDRRGKLTCHLKGVFPYASLMLEILTPVTEETLILQNETHVIEKKDGTFDVSFVSHYSIIDNTIERLVMKCSVPEMIFKDRLRSTTLELILPKVPPRPVVKGCLSQNDHCFLEVKRSGTLICKVEEPTLEGNLTWRIEEEFLSKSITLYESTTQNYNAVASYTVNDNMLLTATFQCVMLRGHENDLTTSVITVELHFIEDEPSNEFVLTGLDELRRLERWNLSMTILLLAVVIFLLGRQARKKFCRNFKKCSHDGQEDGCSTERCFLSRCA